MGRRRRDLQPAGSAWPVANASERRHHRAVAIPRDGATIESLTYVKLDSSQASHLAAFESWCRKDASTITAAMLAGGWDYALWGRFACLADAHAWALKLRMRAAVEAVRQQIIQTRPRDNR